MNKVWMATAVAVILAASGLGYAFMASEANHRGDENLNAEIEAVDSDLTSLQNKLILLNSSLAQLSKSLGDLGTNLEQDVTDLQADISIIRTDITHLKSDVANLSSEISSVQEDIMAVQTLIAELQTRLTSIETKVSTLESKRPLVVRIWFLSLEPDSIPVTGEDYLFDVKLSWGLGIESYVYGRTGHSRFVAPNYLDLSVNRTLMGSTVGITIFAYWHANDILIDINGDSADYHLMRNYKIGTVFQETVDGSKDGRGTILDPYDAVMAYKIETQS